MGVYTKFSANVLFPAHEFLKKHKTLAWRKFLDKSQWFSANELEQLQVDLLKQLLTAASKIPYYQQLFKNYPIDIANIDSLDCLASLPLLDKSIVTANFDNFKDPNCRSFQRQRTGGSTGEPFQFLLSKHRIAHDVAGKWRSYRWWDVDFGDKELVLWGSDIECNKQSRVRAIRDKVFRSHLFAARDLSNKKVIEILDYMQSLQPKILFGYPSILGFLASSAFKFGYDFSQQDIKVAFVTSEVLDENVKKTIERVFKCKVANGYGGRDAGFIAHSCPAGKMHVTQEDIIVEIVDKNGKNLAMGQEGEVVVTNLASQDFPFIRYRTGDIAALDPIPCDCGRGLICLKNLSGRTSDLIRSVDGSVVHRAELVSIITKIDGVQRFQFVQKTLDQSILKLQSKSLTADLESRLRRNLQKLLGQKMQLEICYLDTIEQSKSGKYKFIVSEVTDE